MTSRKQGSSWKSTRRRCLPPSETLKNNEMRDLARSQDLALIEKARTGMEPFSFSVCPTPSRQSSSFSTGWVQPAWPDSGYEAEIHPWTCLLWLPTSWSCHVEESTWAAPMLIQGSSHLLWVETTYVPSRPSKPRGSRDVRIFF